MKGVVNHMKAIIDIRRDHLIIMKSRILFPLSCIFLLLLNVECTNNDISSENKQVSQSAQQSIGFNLIRGINLSHWLSQSNRFGPEQDEFITERDMEFLATMGYDHVRLPVDEEHLWDEQGKEIIKGFRLLKSAIGWCQKYQLRIIVDLHIIRSHYFNSKENTLFTDASQRENFIGMWLQISDSLKDYPTDLLAYEILNEAVAQDAAQWNELIASTVKAIRIREPERKIVIGSNGWQNPATFDELVLPEGDKNIILSFHFYDPHIFTHYQARWEQTGQYTGQVHYPGKSIGQGDLADLPLALKQELEQYTYSFTKDSILARIQEPLAYARAKGLPLYCGEFGCLPTAPRQARLQWYADMRDVLESNGIAWANWDYKGGFAIFDFQTGYPDRELIEVLLGDRKSGGVRSF